MQMDVKLGKSVRTADGQRVGRVVLVIDALDELETAGQRLAFLPPELPEGVSAVLTCRPEIPLVNALRTRL